MKNYIRAFVISTFIVTLNQANFECDPALYMESAATAIPPIFVNKNNTSMATALGSGLGAIFCADYCKQIADDSLASLKERKRATKFGKATIRTWASLFYAMSATGYAYGISALASIPLRYAFAPGKQTFIHYAFKK